MAKHEHVSGVVASVIIGTILISNLFRINYEIVGMWCFRVGLASNGLILAYSAYLLAPGGLQALGALAGIRGPLPLGFNVCVSNVPGPRDPRYLRGSRMEAYYPASIPIHGMALNITVLSYAGTLNVGFIGDRDALPHLQRLAVYTGEALAELDGAVS